jgi:hypothetical protein
MTYSPTMRLGSRMRLWTAAAVAIWAGLGLTADAFAETRLEGPIRQDQVWEEALSPYRMTGLVTVEADATVTIPPGVVVRFDKGSRLEVKGALMAGGAVFDGMEDVYNQEKIMFHPESRGRLTRCTVLNLELAIRTSTALIADSVVSNHNGSGIAVGKDCQPAITRNDFLHNSYYAVYKEGHDRLRAPHNYWGSADGPSGTGPGRGDAINAPIDCMPFAAAEMEDHLILVERNLDPTLLRPGGRFTLTYDIVNLNSFDHAAILGASIYLEPDRHIHSPSNDRRVTIKSGRHRFTRSFDLPEALPEGRYTVIWGVMKADLTAYYVLEEDPQILSVGAAPAPTAPTVIAPGWVPLKKPMPF